MGKIESEFGSGLVYCLVLFAKHWWKHNQIQETYRGMRELPGASQRYFSEGDATRSWFDGAADHLDEMRIPENMRNTKLGKKIKSLKNLAMRCRDGSETKAEDFDEAIRLMEDIAVDLDRYIGIDPVPATWR